MQTLIRSDARQFLLLPLLLLGTLTLAVETPGMAEEPEEFQFPADILIHVQQRDKTQENHYEEFLKRLQKQPPGIHRIRSTDLSADEREEVDELLRKAGKKREEYFSDHPDFVLRPAEILAYRDSLTQFLESRLVWISEEASQFPNSPPGDGIVVSLDPLNSYILDYFEQLVVEGKPREATECMVQQLHFLRRFLASCDGPSGLIHSFVMIELCINRIVESPYLKTCDLHSLAKLESAVLRVERSGTKQVFAESMRRRLPQFRGLSLGYNKTQSEMTSLGALKLVQLVPSSIFRCYADLMEVDPKIERKFETSILFDAEEVLTHGMSTIRCEINEQQVLLGLENYRPELRDPFRAAMRQRLRMVQIIQKHKTEGVESLDAEDRQFLLDFIPNMGGKLGVIWKFSENYVDKDHPDLVANDRLVNPMIGMPTICRALIALRRHELAHGELPETLDELELETADGKPLPLIDPHTFDLLRYNRAKRHVWTQIAASQPPHTAHEIDLRYNMGAALPEEDCAKKGETATP